MKKNSMVLVAASLCTVLVVVGLLPLFSGAGNVSSRVEEEAERLVSEGGIPSLHVCVVSGSEIKWVRGFGEQTSPDTVFLIGSIQKVLVAVSVLQLCERGVVDLDGDVNDYLPFSVRNPYFPDTSVTVRMLLSHRSGLRQELPYEFCYDWDGLYYPDYAEVYNPSVIGMSLGDFLYECLTPGGSYYIHANWLFEPGTNYSYSNSGCKLLMHLIETVTNRTISDYMRENIFEPMLMNNTGFYASDFLGHHAIPHTRVHGSNKELPTWDGQYMIRSTVNDIGRLVIALMNKGRYNGFQLLQSDTVDMMSDRSHSDAMGINLGKELLWQGYGLGLDLFSLGLLGHGGSTVGFTGLCYFNPAKKVGYVRLSNINSILGADNGEFQDIQICTAEIRNLIMTDVGLIPRFSLEDKIAMGVIGIGFMMVGRIVLRVIRRRSARYPFYDRL